MSEYANVCTFIMQSLLKLIGVDKEFQFKENAVALIKFEYVFLFRLHPQITFMSFKTVLMNLNGPLLFCFVLQGLFHILSSKRLWLLYSVILIIDYNTLGSINQ